MREKDDKAQKKMSRQQFKELEDDTREKMREKKMRLTFSLLKTFV